MVRLFEFGFSGDVGVTYLQPEALKILKIKPAQFEKLLDQLCEQFVEITDLRFA